VTLIAVSAGASDLKTGSQCSSLRPGTMPSSTAGGGVGGILNAQLSVAQFRFRWDGPTLMTGHISGNFGDPLMSFSFVYRATSSSRLIEATRRDASPYAHRCR